MNTGERHFFSRLSNADRNDLSVDNFVRKFYRALIFQDEKKKDQIITIYLQ